MFSWLTSDTNECIPVSGMSNKENIKVKMIDDKGQEFYEKSYEGYGVFGGKDFYILVAEMNSGMIENIYNMDEEEKRSAGLGLAFGNNAAILPKLVTADCTTPWEKLDNSKIIQNMVFTVCMKKNLRMRVKRVNYKYLSKY